MNYEQVISAAKNATRASLRAGRILDLTAVRYELTQDLNNLENQKAEKTTDLRVAEFDKAKIDAEHPRAKELVEAQDKAIEHLTKEIENYDKTIAEVNKQVTEVNEKIKAFATGEKKFKYEKVVEGARALLKKHFEDEFVKGSFDGMDLDKESEETPADAE